ncbi:MAG: spondin domain-containing protein [Planctomycetota bacterium]
MIRAISVCAIAASTASGQNVEITFENLLAPTGTAFTPVFFSLDDGSFNLFDPGGTASPGLELVAEVGQTGTLASEFASGSTGFSATGPGGPVLGGGSTSVSFDVTDSTQTRFLNFATMIVPTNDLFIGTPEAIEVFNADGTFRGPFTIEIFGAQVWDAGTEVNNADNGAAFLQGIDGAAGAVEGGTIQLFFNDPGASDYLSTLVGRTTAPGFELASTFDAATPIARITVVPAPGAAVAMLGAAGLVGGVRRRR